MMPRQYETVVGLEIHAELATATKLFCGCKNDPFGAAEPNLYICPVCLGLPGTLPVMNRAAVEWAVRVGAALGCQIGWPKAVEDRHGDTRLAIGDRENDAGTEQDANPESQIANRKSPLVNSQSQFTKWDRKNYFYPDLPKGYQISQYDLPLDHQGSLRVGDTDIAITRIHLEEDTGRLVHPAGVNYSLIDFNRSGVPLLELVTEPVIRTSAQAGAFAQNYQLLLRTLGVSDADMEKGQMRVEANISVRPIGTQAFGTKVEVKNLNSFRSVERAIAYETDRQIALIESGGAVVQETRGWNEVKNETYHMRVKETAAQYRYFPEPDLPPITLDTPQGIDVDKIRKGLPELPWVKLERYQTDLAIRADDAERLVLDLQRSRYLDEIVAPGDITAQTAANVVLNDLEDTTIPASSIHEMIALMEEGTVTGKLAKELLIKLRSSERSPRTILEEEGLGVVRDTGQISALIQETIAAHPQPVADYKAGKAQALGFLIGQIMAKSKGQADPGLTRQELVRILEEEK